MEEAKKEREEFGDSLGEVEGDWQEMEEERTEGEERNESSDLEMSVEPVTIKLEKDFQHTTPPYVRRKKGRMTNIYLEDEDEETIVKFVKEHRELYDKNHPAFQNKDLKDQLWEEIASTCGLHVQTCKRWFESQRTRYGKLSKAKLGKSPRELTARQMWLTDKMAFLKSHIQRKNKGHIEPQQYPGQGVAASADNLSRGSTDAESLVDTTVRNIAQQSQVMNPMVQSPAIDTQLIEQFSQMKNALGSYLCSKPVSTRSAFFNYLALEAEKLDESDFQQFRNETFSLLSNIQAKAQKRAVSAAVATFVPHPKSSTSSFLP